MNRDQAHSLRVAKNDNLYSWPRPAGRTLSISGGKGGVGKSAIAVNLAVAFGARGAKTLLVDGDLGMADLNLLLGLAPQHSVLDLLKGSAAEDVLVTTHGVQLLPGLNGSSQLANLSVEARGELVASIQKIASTFEQVVIDTAAGISATTMSLAAAATDVVVVATTEPLSLADAYSAIKSLSHQHRVERVFLVPNSVKNKAEADQICEQLKSLVARFLDVELVTLPYVPFDPQISLAGASGTPIVLSHPDSPASRALLRISRLMEAPR